MKRSNALSLVPTDTTVLPAAPVALKQALEQSREVKAKVETCAEDLAQANEGTKRTIATGATTLPARQTLDHNEAVETKVQECAEDLGSVTKTLAQGIDELKVVEIALASSRTALAEATASLASRAGERGASQSEGVARPDNGLAEPNVVQRSALARPRACRTP